ncbi:hypothetical protein RJ641_006899 [Dillenia turbinata]|uniref:Uncharacterized protein n=1 Tax=Dillenia turbinata TaxID=194707 RepID=A0AAN8ZC84_9MAGN
MARRRQRENAQAKIRKTAEKLLLKQVKRLKELTKEIEEQSQKNDKGKRVLIDETDITVGDTSEKNGFSRSNQELDELLAASLAAEEDDDFSGNASTSAAGFALEEDDCDEDEEMILPTIPNKVDPAVLASLPPSMQLDLLVQAPEKFSEMQIQAYLKTVAFRREIDEVQKAAAGRGVGGVQTSRIASEANREFIFSSSFTGDKGICISDLTSAGKEGNESGPPQMQNLSGTLGNISSALKNASGTGPSEPDTCYDDDVETYLDERGVFESVE